MNIEELTYVLRHINLERIANSIEDNVDPLTLLYNNLEENQGLDVSNYHNSVLEVGIIEDFNLNGFYEDYVRVREIPNILSNNPTGYINALLTLHHDEYYSRITGSVFYGAINSFVDDYCNNYVQHDFKSREKQIKENFKEADKEIRSGFKKEGEQIKEGFKLVGDRFKAGGEDIKEGFKKFFP